MHSAQEVREVVDRARQVQPWWADLGFSGRKPYLRRWIRWMAEHCDEIFELGHRETARPQADLQFELLAGLEDVRWAMDNAKRVLRTRRLPPGLAAFNFDARVSHRPMGVVGAIVPWNVPIYLTLSSISSALAAGNSVVVKPSEISPGVSIMLLKAFTAANPDAPEGLLGWVTGFGETGSALCTSGVDKIAFTGSVPTGRRVMAACSSTLTPVVLELGGKDATIVAPDANVTAAAHDVVFGGFFNGGQACVGIERVYVVQSVRDEFLAAVRERVSQLTLGVGPADSYGPMTVASQIEVVRRHVTQALEAGATALVGGLDSIRPPYVEPIVLVDVPEHCAALTEETFGPLIVINTVPDVDEAVRRANGTAFGLGASVFSKRKGPQIAARLRSGGTTINSVMTFVGMSSLPFGGVGDSGFGRFHGAEGLREFSYVNSTVRMRFPMGGQITGLPRRQQDVDLVRKVLRMRYGRIFR